MSTSVDEILGAANRLRRLDEIDAAMYLLLYAHDRALIEHASLYTQVSVLSAIATTALSAPENALREQRGWNRISIFAQRLVSSIVANRTSPRERRAVASVYEHLARSYLRPGRSDGPRAVRAFQEADRLLEDVDEFKLGNRCGLSWAALAVGDLRMAKRELAMVTEDARSDYSGADGLRHRLLGHIASRRLVGAVLGSDPFTVEEAYEVAVSHYGSSGDPHDPEDDHWLGRAKVTMAHFLYREANGVLEKEMRANRLFQEATALIGKSRDPTVYTSLHPLLHRDHRDAYISRMFLHGNVTKVWPHAGPTHASERQAEACRLVLQVLTTERDRLLAPLAGPPLFKLVEEGEIPRLRRTFFGRAARCVATKSAEVGLPTIREAVGIALGILAGHFLR